MKNRNFPKFVMILASLLLLHFTVPVAIAQQSSTDAKVTFQVA